MGDRSRLTVARWPTSGGRAGPTAPRWWPNGGHDTAPRPRYGPEVRRFLIRVACIAVAVALCASPASADPGPFRRTTPRASLYGDAGGLIVGIPSGRAWGIESGLQPLDGASRVTLRLAVDDPDVAEAFVRIAYYARLDARTRQLETRDSPFVRVGDDRRVIIELDPPPGAVAYRVRVLGRLVAGAGHSRPDAIRARLDHQAAEQGRERPSLTRLEIDLP